MYGHWSRTRLYVSGEREVLPEGVTLEAVVCQDTPQVWVVGEEDAKHVPYLHKHTHIQFVRVHCHKIIKQTLMNLQIGPAGCDSPPSHTSWQPCGPRPQSPRVLTHPYMS